MVAKECAHLLGAFASPRHAQFQRFKATQEHPGGVGIADAAHWVADQTDLVEHGLRTDQRAGDQVAMAADVLGQRVDRDIRSLRQRLGP